MPGTATQGGMFNPIAPMTGTATTNPMLAAIANARAQGNTPPGPGMAPGSATNIMATPVAAQPSNGNPQSQPSTLPPTPTMTSPTSQTITASQGTNSGTTPTSNQELYGTSTLGPTVSWDPKLLQGLGPAALSAPASWGTPQTFNPTTPTNYQGTQDLGKFLDWMSSSADPSQQAWLAGKNMTDTGVANAIAKNPYFNSDVQGLLGSNGNNISIGQVKNIYDPLNTSVQSTENANLAGYNATNAANAKYAQFLQQGAIAQNRLLGQLNQRGLLSSYLKGGAGNTDMNLLQQDLNNASNDQGAALQSSLNGLNSQDAAYQLALNNYQNEFSNYGQQRAANNPGILDWLGIGASALPLVL